MTYQKEKLKTQSHLPLQQGESGGISLSKEVKGLYTDNCETMTTDGEEDTNQREVIAHSWIRRNNFVTQPYFRKQSPNSTQSLPKLQCHFSQS